MEKKIMTLCIIYEHPRVLLAMKKRGFGEGRYNGYGGKLEEGETIEEAARREVKEEIGVEVSELEKLGILQFSFQDNADKIFDVHHFRVTQYSGEPRETEEMKPEWFNVNNIPYERMWPDDKYWMPLFFQGKKFQGRCHFKDKDTILENNIREVEELI